MSDEKQYSEADVHRFFAKQYHGKTWELLDKTDRTAVENECLADYAHASLAHWRVAGTAVHYQRGVWLLSRVYAVLGDPELALMYARRMLELTEEHLEELEKFDQAFAFEAMARAHALTGNVIEAQLYLKSAQQAGEEIPEKEDRDVFFAELNNGDWNSIRG
jgi:tetratricopeptide (TPR) repeat protein